MRFLLLKKWEQRGSIFEDVKQIKLGEKRRIKLVANRFRDIPRLPLSTWEIAGFFMEQLNHSERRATRPGISGSLISLLVHHPTNLQWNCSVYKLFHAQMASFKTLSSLQRWPCLQGLMHCFLFPSLTFNWGVAPICTCPLLLRFSLCSSHLSPHPGLKTFFRACLCSRLGAPWGRSHLSLAHC